MKILLVGDTHASRHAVDTAFELASINSCDRIFQVGDFGFWPKTRDGNKFLSYTNDLVVKTGIPLYFLAGNHEDWNDLDYIFAAYRSDEDGFFKYGDMFIAPRVNAWVWDNLRFASMSGAFSIDRKFRTQNLDWFEQELPEFKDVEFLFELLREKQIESVDVMLAHDAPINLMAHLVDPAMTFDHPLAYHAQAVMNYAVTNILPKVFVHGHWHMGARYWHDSTYCYALNEVTNGAPYNAFSILDTTNRTMSSIYEEHTTVVFEIH